MLEKPEFFWSNLSKQERFLNFGFLGILQATGCGFAGPGPEMGQKPPNTGQKRILGITFSRGGDSPQLPQPAPQPPCNPIIGPTFGPNLNFQIGQERSSIGHRCARNFPSIQVLPKYDILDDVNPPPYISTHRKYKHARMLIFLRSEI